MFCIYGWGKSKEKLYKTSRSPYWGLKPGLLCTERGVQYSTNITLFNKTYSRDLNWYTWHLQILEQYKLLTLPNSGTYTVSTGIYTYKTPAKQTSLHTALQIECLFYIIIGVKIFVCVLTYNRFSRHAVCIRDWIVLWYLQVYSESVCVCVCVCVQLRSCNMYV